MDAAELMDAAAENKRDILLPGCSGLTKRESCWTKAYSDRSLLSNAATTRGFAVSGPRAPAASPFRSSIVGGGAPPRPHATPDDQRSRICSSPFQKPSKVPGLMLPCERSLQEPFGKGMSWDLKVAVLYGRQSTAAVARIGRHLKA